MVISVKIFATLMLSLMLVSATLPNYSCDMLLDAKQEKPCHDHDNPHAHEKAETDSEKDCCIEGFCKHCISKAFITSSVTSPTAIKNTADIGTSPLWLISKSPHSLFRPPIMIG